MAEAATAQLFRDNGMNIWHGVPPSLMSAFFHWEQEVHGSKLEIGIPNKHSVNHRSKRWRAHWGIRRKTLRQGARHNGNPQTKGWSLFFAFCGPISGVEIWTQNWVHQVAQQLKSGRKPDPVFGSTKLAWFVPGASLLQPFFLLSGDSYLADGSLRGCQVCRQGGVVFECG